MKLAMEEGVQIAAAPPDFLMEARENARSFWDEWATSVGPDGQQLIQLFEERHNAWIAQMG